MEQALEGAHRAAARDLLEMLSTMEPVERTIVATDDPSWGHALADLPVTLDIDPPGECFHFGRRLAGLIERYDLERVLYTGGGSAPLLQVEQWAEVLDQLGRAERLVITNNVHSSDWAAFTPAQEATSLIADQTNDNAIAWALVNEEAFHVRTMEASAGSRFDIDTPVDLLIAQHHPGIGLHLRRYLDDLGWESPQLDGVLDEMSEEGGSLIVAGRASPEAWEALQRATRCWVRVFAEERGMRASGRQGSGEVRSLLSRYLDLVGFRGFFETLGELANGVLLDNRVILASRGLWPSAMDRFNSDLYRWDEVKDPFLRALTRAALEAEVPVVMGGHTVVAGGLMALAEAAYSDDLASRGRERTMTSILVVCTGNLCRSPMAAALLRARLDEDEDRRDWRVISAGTWASEGRPASAYAIEEIAERGIDIRTHRSRSVDAELMREADLVLVMTRNHVEALSVAFPDQAHKVHMLTEMVEQAYDIPDPYGGPRAEYSTVAQELEQLIEAGYERIVSLAEDASDSR